jgi:hypothetical protein
MLLVLARFRFEQSLELEKWFDPRKAGAAAANVKPR